MIDSYYDGSDVITAHNGGNNYVRISPSSISDFFENTSKWYRQTLLNETFFEGSTSTVLGTICHYLLEAAANNVIIENPQKVVLDYLSKIDFDIDKEMILELYPNMSELLINESITDQRFHSTEQFNFHQLLPSIYLGGTYDRLTYDTFSTNPKECTYVLGDYKTASTKPAGISSKYRMQLLTYAWLLKQKGLNVTFMELHFVVRPTKTLPPRYFHFKEPVTNDQLVFIEDQLKLISESVDLWNKHPELRWALAQDYRLKSMFKAPPKLFGK